MRIKVWRAYTGNRCKDVIELGIYDNNDSKLNGLARYLIDNGNAVEIAADIVEVPIILKQRSLEEQDEYLKQHHESLVKDAIEDEVTVIAKYEDEVPEKPPTKLVSKPRKRKS